MAGLSLWDESLVPKNIDFGLLLLLEAPVLQAELASLSCNAVVAGRHRSVGDSGRPTASVVVKSVLGQRHRLEEWAVLPFVLTLTDSAVE